jgi:hypothetical protein
VVNVNFALIGANGDTIVFDQRNYVLNPDFIGFHIPPSQVRIEDSAGDGGVFRHAKRGIRNIDLPVTVLGSSRADVQAKLRRLARVTQHNAGPLVIQAQYTDGKRLTLEAYYVGGGEGQWGEEAGEIWNRWVLQLRAPRPFWRSTTVQQFTVTGGGTGRGLLPQLSKLRVSSSQSLGTIQINNTGDVASFPTYRIIGPIQNLSISNGTVGFSFAEPVLEGEVIFVNTETGEVTDQTGANRYSILSPAPKLFRIPTGESAIFIEGTDTGPSTRIDAFYSQKFEVVH